MSVNLNPDQQKYGYIFNIQAFSVHDGPGIRTLVFLKGCPLKCSWCCNPESQSPQPELAYNSSQCIGTAKCKRCLPVCESGAITPGPDSKIRINRKACTGCFLCVDACPSKTLTTYGKRMSIEEVLTAVEKDSLFYARSGGGISLSGGEPFFQAEFAIELLNQAKRRRLNATIETCGFTEWANLEKACQYLNSIIYDIKCMDNNKHKDFTHVSNELILSNFIKLCDAYPDLPKLVRTPVIPSFNDNEKDIQAIIDFIKGKPNVKYELLPYHRLGRPKYEYIGKECPFPDVRLSDKKVLQLKALVKNLN